MAAKRKSKLMTEKFTSHTRLFFSGKRLVGMVWAENGGFDGWFSLRVGASKRKGPFNAPEPAAVANDLISAKLLREGKVTAWQPPTRN
jgi:hypothetical protein